MARKKQDRLIAVKVLLVRRDYEYLKALSKASGYSIASLIREAVSELAEVFRLTFGEDIGELEKVARAGGDIYVRKLVRVGLSKMGKALEEAEGVLERMERGERRGPG